MKCTVKKESGVYPYQIINPGTDKVIAVASTRKEAIESAKIEATNRNRVYIAKITDKIECR